MTRPALKCPETVIVYPLEEIAKSNCAKCNGTGLVRIIQGKTTVRSRPYQYSEDFCSCMPTGYRKTIGRDVKKMSCVHCDRIGDYCVHRPADFKSYVHRVMQIALYKIAKEGGFSSLETAGLALEIQNKGPTDVLVR